MRLHLGGHLSWYAPQRAAELAIELAVRKMTQDTAALYGLDDRGILAVGKKGDLNVIDLARLENGLPEVAFDLPAGAARFVQRAVGVAAGANTLYLNVITNGSGGPGSCSGMLTATFEPTSLP